jgi:hypothetical protein
MGKTIIAATDLYLNADKSTAVLEGPDAAFLLRRRGGAVAAEWLHLVGDDGYPLGHSAKPAARPKPKKKPAAKPAARKGRARAAGTKEVKPKDDK